jgi:hypothetical protein
MKYTVIYTQTHSVEIEAENEEAAVRVWEDMDLNAIQLQAGSPSPMIQLIEWQSEDGSWHITEY